MERYCKNEKPFVYSIFSGQDSGQAIPVMQKISEADIRFWYADLFSKKERKRMDAASSCILFISNHSMHDENVCRSIQYAVKSNKKILCILLEPTPLSPGQELLLNSLQSVDKGNFRDDSEFFEKLKSAEVLSEMQITAAQKKFARQRAFAMVFIPIASAVVLFFTVVVPLLVAPMVQAATGSLSKVGFGNLSLEELAKVEKLNIIGMQSMDQWYFAYYMGSKEEVFINGLNVTVPVGDISDISDFALLKNAKEIAIEGNQVTDISPLFKIKTLERLTLNCNPITTIEGIEALQNLNNITITNTRISDISPLFKIPTLEQISFENTYVNSIEGIQNLKRVIDLRTGNSNLTDISALNEMDFSYSGESKGFGFEAKNSLIRDFSPLMSVPKFSQIMISIDRIERILPFIRDKQVTDLYIEQSDITAISSLSSILGLKILLLPASANLSSLEGIETHVDLMDVNFEWCPNITDFTPLLKLPNLKRLTIGSDKKDLAAAQLAGAAFEIVYLDK